MTVRKLNITMTYPIQWGLGGVMRDYIQNFYDALTPETFGNDFRYDYDDQPKILTMSAAESFDMEWLFYIGVSSKRNATRCYAGKFGEGFKIASLVAYRDYGLDITMESKDWRIHVTETKEMKDGQCVRFLAYEIRKRRHENNSVLKLKNVEPDGYQCFLDTIHDFYYIGNPNFGAPICTEETFAIYQLPDTAQEARQRTGLIYFGYQMRGFIGLPLIFCYHPSDIDKDDRDRLFLTDEEKLRCIYRIIDRLDVQKAGYILELLRNYWNGRLHTDSGKLIAPIIKDLVRAVALSDPHVRRDFLGRIEKDYIADFSNNISGNRKRIAQAWFRNSKYYRHRKVILHEFTAIGLRDIEQLCAEENGFQVLRDPTDLERKYIQILRNAAEAYFSDIIRYEIIPPCKVIVNKNAPVSGLAHLREAPVRLRNAFDLETRYTVSNIYLKRELLCRESFGSAFSVYLHELLHQFGGDCSIQFNKALLLMDRRLMMISEDLTSYREQWLQIVKADLAESTPI